MFTIYYKQRLIRSLYAVVWFGQTDYIDYLNSISINHQSMKIAISIILFLFTTTFRFQEHKIRQLDSTLNSE